MPEYLSGEQSAELEKIAQEITEEFCEKETTYAIQCYRNDERLMTDDLTEGDARCLLVAAKHLAEYLRIEYLTKDASHWFETFILMEEETNE